jgi:hypothetical protein
MTQFEEEQINASYTDGQHSSYTVCETYIGKPFGTRVVPRLWS